MVDGFISEFPTIFDNGLKYLFHCWFFIRGFLIHKLVDNNANRPPVWRSSIRFSLSYFRSHSYRSSTTRVICLTLLNLFGQTKITKFGVSIFIKKNIGHLNVSMDDVVLMQVSNGWNQLMCPKQNSALRHKVLGVRCDLFLVQILQVSSSWEIHMD